MEALHPDSTASLSRCRLSPPPYQGLWREREGSGMAPAGLIPLLDRALDTLNREWWRGQSVTGSRNNGEESERMQTWGGPCMAQGHVPSSPRGHSFGPCWAARWLGRHVTPPALVITLLRGLTLPHSPPSPDIPSLLPDRSLCTDPLQKRHIWGGTSPPVPTHCSRVPPRDQAWWGLKRQAHNVRVSVGLEKQGLD